MQRSGNQLIRVNVSARTASAATRPAEPGTGMAPSSVQMIDSTIVCADQHASGVRREFIRRVLSAREVARRPRSI
jgi:hypothetical protein